jgi:Domain of unknown function (DUF4440)
MKSFDKIITILVAALVYAIPLAFADHGPLLPADAPSAAQQAIIRVEQRWIGNEYNPAVLDSILADDFVHVLPEGLISKQEHIAYVRAHPMPALKVHRFERLQVRVYGNVAIANGIVLAVPMSGVPRRTLFTDVFVLRAGRWQAVNAQETPAGN